MENFYIYTCIHFSPHVDCTGQRAQHRTTWMVVYSVLTALSAIGTLSRNHSLSRRRQELSLIRQEATKVSDQEMKTKKSSDSARGGVATG